MPLNPRLTNIGIPLHSEYLGGESDTVREIPPDWRAALDLFVVETPVPLTWNIPPLSDTILAVKSEQKLTSEKSLRVTSKPAGQKVLTEKFTSRDKQLGTRTRTFKTIGDSIASPTATIDVNTKNFGNFHFEESVEDTGSLFVAAEFEKTIPDPVPEKFKVLVPVSTQTDREIGIAVDPTLGSGDLSIAETQENVFVKKMRHVFRDLTGLPKSLSDYKLTPEGQIETVVDTLDLGLQTLAPDALTLEGEVRNLGNSTSVRSVGTVPDVFPRNLFSTERQILWQLPPEFRAAFPEVTTRDEVAGTASPPTLSGGDFMASEEQITEFRKREERKTRDLSALPIMFTDYRVTSKGQVETIVKTLTDSSPGVPTPSATILEDDVQNMGIGLFLQTVGSVPDVFPENTYSKSILDLIPAKFRAAVPMYDSDVTSAGIASIAPVLGFGELERSETQVTEFVKRVRVKSLGSISTPVVLTNQELTEKFGGGVVEEVLTLDSSAGTIDTGLRVIDSNVINLGNGYYVKLTQQLVDLTWPVLVGTQIEDDIDLIIPISRQVVDAGTTGGIVGNVRTTVEPRDFERSEKLVRTIPTDLSALNRTYPTVINHRFPDTVVNLQLVWAAASVGIKFTVDYGLSYDILKGYAGPCDGEITETYTFGPPTTGPTVTKFFPQRVRRTIEQAYAAEDGDTGAEYLFARIWEFEVPESLHAAFFAFGQDGGGVSSVKMTSGGSGYTTPPTVSFTGGGGVGAMGTAVLTMGKVSGVNITSSGFGYVTAPAVVFSGGGGSGAAATAKISAVDIPATNPPTLPPSGTPVVIDIQTERSRYGIYRTKVFKVFVP